MKMICINTLIMIHSPVPQSLPVVIIIFSCMFPSVPTFQNIAKQNKRRMNIMITTGGTD